jgi:hypothetical protein
MALLGVDVSSNNGPIDWPEAYRAGVRVAYVKATQGVNYRSPTYQAQVKGARAAGIAVGAYHFSRPAVTSPGAAWAYFKAYAATAPVNLPPMVDDEAAGGMGFPAVKAWMLEFLRLAGPTALHYSNLYFLQNIGPLGRQWTARPGMKGLTPPDFATQISLGSHLAGFSGAVDVDYFSDSILSPPPSPIDPKGGKMICVRNSAGNIAIGNGLYFLELSGPEWTAYQATYGKNCYVENDSLYSTLQTAAAAFQKAVNA